MSQTAPPPNLVNQDGSPKLTVSQRRSQLDEIRFVDVRHLVYMSYKKPDLSPLMQYEDTLDNRDVVKLAALNYELHAGWLIRDGTESQGLPVAQPQPAVPPGVQVMSNTPPFAPPQQNGAPQQQFAPQQQPMQFAPPQQQAPQQFAPHQQQGTFAPPQQQFQPPAPQQQMQQPQQQAAPQQQEQPAAAPAGRKRKGAAVAPPPAAPGTQPAQGQPPMQQFQQPQQQAPQQFAPQGQVPVQQFQPPAPQQFVPQAPAPQQFSAPAPQMQAPQQATGVDLTPVLARIDAVGAMLTAQAKENADTKLLLLKGMAVLHHMYLVAPGLQPQQGQPQVPRTLPEFLTFLTQFTGTP